MFEVKLVNYDELPEEVEKLGLSNNGCGKEYATYLLVYHDSKLIFYESDAMEKEDAYFYRDLKWIKDAIEEAYELGKQDGKGQLDGL